MWMSVDLYQGWGGISRAMFLVRQGASKGLALFFPKMPPMTVRGKPTSSQTVRSSRMVVAGRACVEPLAQCTEFTTLHVRKKGTAGTGPQKEGQQAELHPWGQTLRLDRTERAEASCSQADLSLQHPAVSRALSYRQPLPHPLSLKSKAVVT